MPPRLYRHWLKPALDRIAAAIGLVLCGPLLMAIAIAVGVRLGYPVIFTQLRPGRHGRLFYLYKFRTMTDAHDEAGRLLPDDERLTQFGRWLRSTSLDELPEIWNVLRGEMSLVGPRPLLPQYLELYSAQQSRRHEVKPGITGLAQVSGRNAISWRERFELDVRYVETVSFWLDLRILCKTIARVLVRDGISASNHSTMPQFTGIDKDEDHAKCA